MGRKPSDLKGELATIVAAAPAVTEEEFTSRSRAKDKARRAEAVSMLLAGLTMEQIAERMHISERGVEDLVDRTLARVVNPNAEKLRAVENARLDRSQAAIWSNVLKGDLQAIDTFLRISARRARMNGLDEPTKVNLSVNIRQEMESALAALEAVVLGEVVDADVIPDDGPVRDQE